MAIGVIYYSFSQNKRTKKRYMCPDFYYGTVDQPFQIEEVRRSHFKNMAFETDPIMEKCGFLYTCEAKSEVQKETDLTWYTKGC